MRGNLDGKDEALQTSPTTCENKVYGFRLDVDIQSNADLGMGLKS